MPRETPETAERMNPQVSTAIIAISALFPRGPAPETISTPWPIWIAESPSVAAVPKTVAKIASMSMPRPSTPLARGPSSERNAEESRAGRPRR